MPTDESFEPEKTELLLYADNEGDLYPQKMAIVKNLKAKVERDVYDPGLAVVGWMHWVNAAAPTKAGKKSSKKTVRKRSRA